MSCDRNVMKSFKDTHCHSLSSRIVNVSTIIKQKVHGFLRQSLSAMLLCVEYSAKGGHTMRSEITAYTSGVPPFFSSRWLRVGKRLRVKMRRQKKMKKIQQMHCT